MVDGMLVARAARNAGLLRRLNVVVFQIVRTLGDHLDLVRASHTVVSDGSVSGSADSGGVA